MKLLDYIRGLRKGKEAHRLEKESMKDPFLADAMDGYGQVEGNHEQRIGQLRMQVSARATKKRNLSKKQNSYAVTWSIAACLVIGIGINENKKTWFPTEKRVEMIEKLFADDPRVKVDAYDCLTIDFARAKEAQFIVRGIRTVHDFEYEETIADINRKLAGIETILLFTEPELTSISSTIVRELLQFGKDVTPFLPEGMKID